MALSWAIAIETFVKSFQWLQVSTHEHEQSHMNKPSLIPPLCPVAMFGPPPKISPTPCLSVHPSVCLSICLLRSFPVTSYYESILLSMNSYLLYKI